MNEHPYLAVAHNACAWAEDCAGPDTVGLHLAQLVGIYESDTRHAVLQPALIESLQCIELTGIGRDDELATPLIFDA
jgi:hypothetical protein